MNGYIKIELAKELKSHNKIKNKEQIKSLVDFLEYLFLIDAPNLESEYEEFKKLQGGVFNLTIDKIRKRHYTQKGIEKIVITMIRKGKGIEEIMEVTELSYEKINSIKDL
jgi:Glu-tRNA(Gln) amidotransferase subunit E-like FAD-binding protein